MQSTRRLRTAVLAALGLVPFFSFAASGPVFMNGQSIYGQPTTQGTPVRVVDLAATDRLNVSYGESVVFRSGTQQFSWTFNGLDRRFIDVSQIAPAGFTSKPFAVHVGRSPSNRH
jgi:hypothetical protein